MTKIDIKALARELKGDGTESKPNTPIENKAGNPSTNKKKPAGVSPNNTKFLELISNINNHNEYNTDGCIYIDSDIHDLLRQIKVRNKLKNWLPGFLVD